MKVTPVIRLGVFVSALAGTTACGSSDKLTAPGCGEWRSVLATAGPNFTPDVSVIVAENRNPAGWEFEWFIKNTFVAGDLTSGAFRVASDTSKVLMNLAPGPPIVAGYLSIGVVGAPNGTVARAAFFDLFSAGSVELVVHSTAKPDSAVKVRLGPGSVEDWAPNDPCLPFFGN